MKKRITTLLLTMVVALSMSVPFVFAEDASAPSTAKKQIEQSATGGDKQVKESKGIIEEGSEISAEDRQALKDFLYKAGKNSMKNDSYDEFIVFYSKKNGRVFYKGEKCKFEFATWDVWKTWYTEPAYVLINDDKEDVEWIDYTGDIGYVDDWTDWTYTINKNLANGNYTLCVLATPVDEDLCYPNNMSFDQLIDDSCEYEVPVNFINFSVKSFAKPTGLKATAGKRKVTVSWGKVTGATKYEIYRSTKKNSGYKKITTTASNKYVDKKVKKGKKYYYKVRAYRSKYGTIRSSFTSPKVTKKVK